MASKSLLYILPGLLFSLIFFNANASDSNPFHNKEKIGSLDSFLTVLKKVTDYPDNYNAELKDVLDSKNFKKRAEEIIGEIARRNDRTGVDSVIALSKSEYELLYFLEKGCGLKVMQKNSGYILPHQIDYVKKWIEDNHHYITPQQIERYIFLRDGANNCFGLDIDMKDDIRKRIYDNLDKYYPNYYTGRPSQLFEVEIGDYSVIIESEIDDLRTDFLRRKYK